MFIAISRFQLEVEVVASTCALSSASLTWTNYTRWHDHIGTLPTAANVALFINIVNEDDHIRTKFIEN